MARVSSQNQITLPVEAMRAAGLRAEHDRLRLPDVLVLATAQELGADLLTYDERLSRIAKVSERSVRNFVAPHPRTDGVSLPPHR